MGLALVLHRNGSAAMTPTAQTARVADLRRHGSLAAREDKEVCPIAKVCSESSIRTLQGLCNLEDVFAFRSIVRRIVVFFRSVICLGKLVNESPEIIISINIY